MRNLHLPIGTGWVHSRRIRYPAAADQLARWWWDGEDLVADGIFDIEAQMQGESMRQDSWCPRS